jgi:hypothetical protein
MKPLLATAGVLALVMSAAACDTADTSELAEYESSGMVAEEPGTLAQTETDAPALTPAEETRPAFTLASGEVEASDLIGASVHDANGEEIATVADVWMADAGSEPMMILRDGGVAGVGGDLHAVDFQTAAIVADAETSGDEPNVIVNYTGETLKTLPKFEQASADDYRLASEMIGTTVAVSYSGDSARINDLILTNTGETRYAVISPDLVSIEQIVVNADAITVAEGDADGALTLDLTEETFAGAPEYPRE